jgi:hypothetical protein
MKVSLGSKKGYNQYDNASPHHSITIEKNVDDELSDEELVAEADKLHLLARKLVETKISADLKELKG